jgi:hypothetical protein
MLPMSTDRIRLFRIWLVCVLHSSVMAVTELSFSLSYHIIGAILNGIVDSYGHYAVCLWRNTGLTICSSRKA